MQKKQIKTLTTKALQQIMGGEITQMPVMHIQDVGSRSIVRSTVNDPTPLQNINDTQG